MLTFLYVIQIIIAVFLILTIFLQKKEDSSTSLLSSNVYNSMFKNMSTPSNPLVKVTLVLGFLFFANSIFISGYIIRHNGQTAVGSDIEKTLQQTQSKPSLKSKKSKSHNKKKPPSVPLAH